MRRYQGGHYVGNHGTSRKKLATYDKVRDYDTYGVSIERRSDGEYLAAIVLWAERVEHSEDYTVARGEWEMCTDITDPRISATDTSERITEWFDKDWTTEV